MNAHIQERTVNGKVWEIHEICPEVGDFCADYGRCNLGDIDWFPSPEEWGMIADLAGDFGQRPEGFTDEQWSQVVEACSKDYVGYVGDVPDPNFWKKIKQNYPMCSVAL